MKLNQKILQAINEGIRKSLLSFDDIEFDQSDSNRSNKKISSTITDWKWIQDNFVDLGLPSGTLWCKWNVGATNGDTPESWYGHYYMWGSLKPNDNDYCDWNIAPFNDESDTFDDYYFGKHMYEFIDNGRGLLSKYDVAYQTNNLMCFPTNDQLEELVTLPNEWITNYNNIKGLNGRIFIGTNGNKLFIPAAGWIDDDSNVNDQGNGCGLWSSELVETNLECAFDLDFGSGYARTFYSDRCCGFSVRGVSNL